MTQAYSSTFITIKLKAMAAILFDHVFLTLCVCEVVFEFCVRRGADPSAMRLFLPMYTRILQIIGFADTYLCEIIAISDTRGMWDNSDRQILHKRQVCI